MVSCLVPMYLELTIMNSIKTDGLKIGNCIQGSLHSTVVNFLQKKKTNPTTHNHRC